VGGATTARAVEYQKGTLVVDIWDPETKELVWRGTASDILISDKVEKTQKNLSKAVADMAKQNQKLRGGDKK
jgi:Domain of unknown function (DUF4136)